VPATKDSAEGDDIRVSGGATISSTSTDERASSDRLAALIISDRGVSTRPLPDSGELVIGRASDSDLVIDDPSISRRHAVLAMDPLSVRDLDSANGTRVRGAAVHAAPVELAPGDVVELGRATLVLQRRSAAAGSEKLWGHDYFELRLDEECARARRDRRSFAVARLRCDPQPPVHTLWNILLAGARTGDVVAEYGPREYEILLHDVSPDSAKEAVARIREELRGRGVRVESGVARFPVDGRSADELIHHASPGPGPRPAGPANPLVLSDRRMQEVYQLAERIAVGQITALILGETGVGKEILAEHIHRSSPRAAGPYLRLNCASLSETLLESELFGHERGAFTDAVTAKPGLLETADGGTVFLDEIGELPLATQTKLLRVLEERTVLRVGALKPRAIDVRFVAATNRDLEAECARGGFREDLYFRLSGATLTVPPLRERVGEIEPLARRFIDEAARQLGLPCAPAVGGEVIELLGAYAWPGNVRELRNAMERAVLLCAPGPLLPAHLPLDKMRSRPSVPATPAANGPPPPVEAPEEDARQAAGEKERILAALAECAGNQTEAARRLGMGRRTLIKRLERYGIQRPRKGSR